MTHRRGFAVAPASKHTEGSHTLRINIYSEELTDRIEVVEKTSVEGLDFIGLRFYLKTLPDLLPPNHPDDDTSAVTFWGKAGADGLYAMMQKAIAAIARNE